MTRSAPATAALLAAGLLAGLLAGCSVSPDTAPSDAGEAPRRHFSRLADLEKAVTARVAADKTAATSTSGTVPGPSGEAATLPEGDGAVEFGADGTAARAYLPMVSGDAAPGLLEAVVRTDDTAWVRTPAGFGSRRPADKPWFGPIQLAETFAGTTEQKLAVLATRAVRAAEPTRAWRSDLYGDGATLVSATDEDLDGVPVVKYRITVDIAKAAAGQDNARRKRALQEYLKQGETSNDVTLWVDTEHRPLRVEQRLGAKDRPTTVDIRYRDWGRPVSIDEPPADQTAR
jgi:hypothetical protein